MPQTRPRCKCQPRSPRPRRADPTQCHTHKNPITQSDTCINRCIEKRFSRGRMHQTCKLEIQPPWQSNHDPIRQPRPHPCISPPDPDLCLRSSLLTPRPRRLTPPPLGDGPGRPSSATPPRGPRGAGAGPSHTAPDHATTTTTPPPGRFAPLQNGMERLRSPKPL